MAGKGALLVLGGLTVAGIAYAVVSSKKDEPNAEPAGYPTVDPDKLALFERCALGQCTEQEMQELLAYAYSVRSLPWNATDRANLEAVIAALESLLSPALIQNAVAAGRLRPIVAGKAVGACCRECELGLGTCSCEDSPAVGACCDDCARGVGACACERKEPARVGGA